MILQRLKHDPSHEVIYTSEPVEFKKKLFLEPITDLKHVDELILCGESSVLIVTSIARLDFDRDITDLTIYISDHINLVVKISGLKSFVENVINLFEDGSLAKDDNCAEKFAFLFYNVTVQLPKRTRADIHGIQNNNI